VGKIKLIKKENKIQQIKLFKNSNLADKVIQGGPKIASIKNHY